MTRYSNCDEAGKMQPAAGASKDAVETKRLAGNEKRACDGRCRERCAVGSSRDRRKKLGTQFGKAVIQGISLSYR